MKKTATDLDSLSPFNAALEQSRGSAGELGNHAIDEFIAGRISRRELLRYASVIGLSLAARRLIGSRDARAQARRGQAGRHDPRGPSDACRRGRSAHRHRCRRPRAAQPDRRIPDRRRRRKARAAARRSRSHGSRTRRATCGPSSCARTSSSTTASRFTAKDVVATFDRLADPASGSAALSVLKGVLSKGGAKVVDDHHGRVPSRRAERQLPVLRFLGNVQRRDPARELSRAATKSRSSARVRSSSKSTRRRSAHRSCAIPDYWGEKALPSA